MVTHYIHSDHTSSRQAHASSTTTHLLLTRRFGKEIPVPLLVRKDAVDIWLAGRSTRAVRGIVVKPGDRIKVIHGDRWVIRDSLIAPSSLSLL